MIDPIQIIFIVVVVILSFLFVVVGVEVIKIIQDAKKTLKKINLVLDDVEVISSSLANPVSKMSDIIQGLQHGAGFVRFMQNLIEQGDQKSSQE